ncbi:hypothetical protein N7497_008962 [Penicillium chrysogenum]|nr:hypothetical protein N7497_008962 [Penicillium chrysogenum]
MAITNPIRRVAVIGAGPSGLAAVKYLLAEKYFDKIEVFEQRSSVGGVWNYSPSSSKKGMSTTVPHLTPHEPAEKPVWIDRAEGGEATFVSPLYDRLETNIPKELMRYSDKAFPLEAQLFPKHRAVKQYLEEYAEDVKSLIQFKTQVLEVKLKDETLSTWSLTAKSLSTGAHTTHTYDAVVVASGHFTVPYIPDIPGIQAWDTSHPGAISHSKFYDSPESFQGKKVVVVGSSASGLDIGAQINEVSQGKVLVSQRSESYLAPPPNGDKIIYPEIVEFLLRQPMTELFYIDHPTLVFPVLSQRVIPFPMAENHAAVFSRVWSARLTLPPKDAMKAWEAAEIDAKGDGKEFHLLPFPMDADYLDFLYDWAEKANPRPGLSNNGQGKLGTRWGERERWMRAHSPDIRRAFVQRGNERSEIKDLSELGFDFEQWKKQQEATR